MPELSGNDKILMTKRELDDSLKQFVVNYKNCNSEKAGIANLIGDISTKHTNLLNTVNRVLSEVHEEEDFFQNKNLKMDYRATVENFILTSLKIVEKINIIAVKNSIPKLTISPKSYDTLQRFINTFSDNETIEKYKSKFQEKNISISGFNQKFKPSMKAKFIKLQLWLGIPLFILCGATILLGEKIIEKDFNGIQLIFLKAFMALTVSIVASSLIEGNATVKWTLQRGLAIRAVGWVAVFLLLYFLNPASPGDVH